MRRECRVWGPLPRRVEVQVGQQRFPMKQEEGGWWTAVLEGAYAGSDYGFMLDGEGPFPDPRSPWQPNGVHALSRPVDHAAFPWTDSGFQARPLSAAIIYELHPGTFTTAGTFAGACEKLDHLVELGVTHVELMPVNAFDGDRGWGYDGVGLFAVHEPYGGPEGLKQFVNTCHARGLAVLLDVVYSHLGPSGNYLGKFASYFNPCFQTPWGTAVNFSGPDSDEVRRFVCDNVLIWLRDYHFDGLRLDAVHAILDTSAMTILEQMAAEVEVLAAQLGRNLALVAESDLNDPRLLWSQERGGFGLHAQWSDDFHHALHSLLTGERTGYYEDYGRLTDLAKALTNGYVFDGQFSKLRRRRHGRPHAGLSGHRFVGYLQNHDQVGNRAMGDRLSHSLDLARLKMGAALVLTAPFVPLLFMGEEWGASTPFLYFADHHEPELARAVCDGRRKEFAAFGWRPEEIPDPQARDTFQRSILDWREAGRPPHSDLLQWYRELIRLRRREPALADGRLDQVRACFYEEARWLVVERGPITVVCNFGKESKPVPLGRRPSEVLLSSVELLPSPDAALMLPGGATAVLKCPDSDEEVNV